ncbi:Uncharacterized protein APZ42_024678 [Daphnia magna]|uniref:Uncharacterized protein n=1 Tax=Daphnia magna TaxID=35525 RepID=A0A164TU90_9CRUS|nr:Uncharacterized protein APZ42_024678 [Daphnia magna]
MEHSDLTQPLAHLGLVELTGGSSSSSFADRPSKVKLDDTIHLGVNGSDDPFFTTASRLDLEPTTAGPHELSPVELAGVIVAAALVTVAIIGLGVWMHCRRKKSKSQETTGGRMNGPHHPVAPQVSVISMETDVRPAAVRQNSYGSTGYIGSHGPYRMDGGSGGQSEEDEMGSFTDYGSIVGSFPPSPAGSFRSALDAPGFSRCLERERGRHLPPSNRSARIVHALATRRRFTPASKRNSRDSCVPYLIFFSRKDGRRKREKLNGVLKGYTKVRERA